MTKIIELAEILELECSLLEGLLMNLKNQQDALIRQDSETLVRLMEASYEIIKPIESLETERMQFNSALLSQFIAESSSENMKLSYLLDYLPDEESSNLKWLGEKVRNTMIDIGKVNKENKLLLEYLLSFVKENIKLVTENYSKQLVDYKI